MNIRQRFFDSVKRGTGEAFLIMKAHPKIDFSKYILKGALKNYDYDPQSNGSRANYITSLIQLSSKKDKLVEGILKALSKEKSDTWALVQLFDIAEAFAKEGNPKARKAIYTRYYKDIIPGSDWCGERSILNLDGLEGLKFIAETKGKAMLNDPDLWEDDSTINAFQKENPKIKVLSELKKATKKNAYIKKYLDSIEYTNKKSQAAKKTKEEPAYNTIVRTIDTNEYWRGSPILVNKLKGDKTGLKQLATDFLKETDKKKQVKYLSVFKRVKFPYDYQTIFEIAKKKKDKTLLVEFANDALSLFTGKDIRDFAISKLNHTKEPYLYIPLLINNYRKGDHKLLKKLASRAKNAEQAHILVWGYCDIYEKNKSKECRGPLIALYDKLDCGRHRLDIIKILIKNHVLPQRIRKEMRYDSFKATRELALSLTK